ncbi:hypothetical protein BH11VER1_BH11VER1_23150 [soil metagenome]
MFARYPSLRRVAFLWTAFLTGALSLSAADQTITGNLTVTGNSALQGTLDVTQGVTVIGDADMMGNIFSIGHSLNADNITQNYSIAGLEIYVKNTNFTTRLIEHATTVDATTFKWGTKAATDLNTNGLLDDFGTLWMSLTSSTLTLPGNLLVNGTDNQLTAQTLTGNNSILTRGLADARYVQLTSTVPVTISNTTAASSSTTGALIIAGGIGVAKDSWINGVRLGRGLAAVSSNTALGGGTLNTNTTGSNNTATGLKSLYANTTGANNSATGVNALRYNTTGRTNTATGVSSLYANTTGSNNAASGYQALKSNTTGGYNTVSGVNAAIFHADGVTALTDPEGSVYIGAETRALNNSDSNSIVIAGRSATARGIGEGANTTVLGNLETVSTKLFGALSQSGGTVITSKPHNFTQTWNAGAITFTGIQSNITDTASAAGSKLLDLQVGGVSKFSVDKAGNVNGLTIGLGGGGIAGNIAIGSSVLSSNTTGINNVATGMNALRFNTTGYGNTASGYQSLYSNTTGYYNVASGYLALYSNSAGDSNTATGYQALYSNTTGIRNTANGQQTLVSNTTGYGNTANGQSALYSNSTGSNNTANGQQALIYNTIGESNTASGSNALLYNTTGSYNVANGDGALFYNTTGSNNVASGHTALSSNTTGSNNTSSGYSAGSVQADGSTAFEVDPNVRPVAGFAKL